MDDLIKKIEETPLRFHYYYVAFILPILTLSNFIKLIQSCFSNVIVTPLFIFGVLESSIFIILGFLAVKGLMRFKRYGLITLYVLHGLTIIDAFLAMYIAFGGNYSPVFVSGLSLRIFLSILIITYYVKRRSLFIKGGVSFLKQEESMEIEENPINTVDIVEDNTVYYCPRCNKEISKETVFCPKCGAQVKKVNR